MGDPLIASSMDLYMFIHLYKIIEKNKERDRNSSSCFIKFATFLQKEEGFYRPLKTAVCLRLFFFFFYKKVGQ